MRGKLLPAFEHSRFESYTIHQFLGGMFRGGTADCKSVELLKAGSIPLVSTNFPAVIGCMLAACHTTVKKVPTFRGAREFTFF